MEKADQNRAAITPSKLSKTVQNGCKTIVNGADAVEDRLITFGITPLSRGL